METAGRGAVALTGVVGRHGDGQLVAQPPQEAPGADRHHLQAVAGVSTETLQHGPLGVGAEGGHTQGAPGPQGNWKGCLLAWTPAQWEWTLR